MSGRQETVCVRRCFASAFHRRQISLYWLSLFELYLYSFTSRVFVNILFCSINGVGLIWLEWWCLEWKYREIEFQEDEEIGEGAGEKEKAEFPRSEWKAVTFIRPSWAIFLIAVEDRLNYHWGGTCNLQPHRFHVIICKYSWARVDRWFSRTGWNRKRDERVVRSRLE